MQKTTHSNFLPNHSSIMGFHLVWQLKQRKGFTNTRPLSPAHISHVVMNISELEKKDSTCFERSLWAPELYTYMVIFRLTVTSNHHTHTVKYRATVHYLRLKSHVWWLLLKFITHTHFHFNMWYCLFIYCFLNPKTQARHGRATCNGWIKQCVLLWRKLQMLPILANWFTTFSCYSGIEFFPKSRSTLLAAMSCSLLDLGKVYTQATPIFYRYATC